MAYPDDIDHGVALYRGAEDYAGFYVQSASFSQSFNNTDYGKDHEGKTKAMHQGDAKMDVSFDALVFDGTEPPAPGEILSYSSFLKDEIGTYVVTKCDLRTENAGYARYSITAEGYPGLLGA